MKNDKKHRLFVEGKSDEGIFSKVIEVYFPELSDLLHFDLKGNNCANSATDKAKAFHLIQKHNKEVHKLKGALILDNDPAGNECKAVIDEFLKDSKSNTIKVSLIPKPPQVYNLVKKGFNVVADLESCLPEPIWKHALESGWLEEKTPQALKFTKNKMTDLFNKGHCPNEFIKMQTNFEQLLINYKFTIQGKENLSKYIKSQRVELLLENSTLSCFEPLFKNIKEFIEK